MNTATTTRCSSLPLAWQCPASQEVDPGEPALNVSHEAAEAGTAFHRWAAAYASGGTQLDFAALAAEHGCDVDELRMLCLRGRRAIDVILEMAAGAEESVFEAPLRATLPGGMGIAGSADWIFILGDTACVVDYKSGRLDSDYSHQSRGYAYCVIRAGKSRIARVVAITVWVRDGVIDKEEFVAAQLHEWADELERRVRNGRGNFTPGAHCGYCRRAATCPGRRAMLRATFADLASDDALSVVDLTPERRAELGPAIGELYGRAKLAEKAVERLRETLRMDIQANGPLPIGGGRQLAMVEVTRRKLDTAAARPVLERHLDPAELDAATTISLSQCEKAAAAAAGKGNGAAKNRAMIADLEAADAISLCPTYQLKEVKALADITKKEKSNG